MPKENNQLIHELYFELESIQEGAEPKVEINHEGKEISITNVWISNHYDVEDTPTPRQVANEVFDSVSPEFVGYQIEIRVTDQKGNKHSFDTKDFQ